MTPKEIDELRAGNELNKLVEIALGYAIIDHLPFVYMEDWTEDGTDGWSGMVCPRCLSSDRNGKCVKPYSETYRHIEELLKWVLAHSGDLFIEWWQDREWYVCNLSQPLRMIPHNEDNVIATISDKVAEGEVPNFPLALCRFILKVALANKSKSPKRENA